MRNNQYGLSDMELIQDQISVRPAPQAVDFSACTMQDDDELTIFFAQSIDLMCVASFDGYFSQLNLAWTHTLGWPLQALKAKPFLEFVHPNDRTTTQSVVAALAEGAETIMFENRYRCHDGSYRWLRWNAKSVPSRRRIYATARDVTQQKQLEREIVEISDREKEHLGRELHDGLCQTLAGIAALSATLSKNLAANSDTHASGAAIEITTLVKEVISDVHEMALGLCLLNLKNVGLIAALERLVMNVQHQFHISCVFTCDQPFTDLTIEVESHLIRVAQEAINNAVIHGHAHHIETSLSVIGEQGHLCIRDDGVGMPETPGETQGIGMHSMTYRAHLIGGSLDMRCHEPNGMTVCCAFPLPKISDTYPNSSNDEPNQ